MTELNESELKKMYQILQEKLEPKQIHWEDIRLSLFNCWSCRYYYTTESFNNNLLTEMVGNNSYICCKECSKKQPIVGIPLNPNLNENNGKKIIHLGVKINL